MTARDARLALTSRPLRFGDPNQTAAVRHLEDLERAREADAGCRHKPCFLCEGTGTYPSKRDCCDNCNGTGTETDCRCFVGLDCDAVFEYRQMVRRHKGAL